MINPEIEYTDKSDFYIDDEVNGFFEDEIIFLD